MKPGVHASSRVLGILLMSLWGFGALVGCHPKEIHPPPIVPETPDARTIRTALRQTEHPHSLRARLRLRIRWGEAHKRRKVHGGIVVDERYGLRMDLAAPLGPPLGVFLSTYHQSVLYLPYQGNSYLFTYNPDNIIHRLFNASIGVHDIIRLVLGGNLECIEPTNIKWSSSSPAARRLHVDCMGVDYALELESSSLRILEIRGRTPEGRTFDIRRDVEAESISIEVDGRTQIDLEFDDAEPNVILGADLFSLPLPPGAHLVPMEDVLVTK